MAFGLIYNFWLYLIYDFNTKSKIKLYENIVNNKYFANNKF